MVWTKSLLVVLIAGAGVGCTANSGKSYQSAGWTPGRPLGKVLVIVPKYAGDVPDEHSVKDQQIRRGVREVLATIPGTTVVDGAPPPRGAGPQPVAAPVSESQAIADARKLDAQTVCIVTVGQFGGRFLVTLLPPGWDLRSTVHYALRLIDVRSGEVLLDSVRERTTGGFLALTNPTVYPSDLKDDLVSVLLAPQ